MSEIYGGVFEYGEHTDADKALDDLVFYGLSRYLEALDKQENLQGVVWLSNERMQRGEGQGDEQVMWVRLGAGEELIPGVDWFDMGVVVDDPFTDQPTPVEQLEGDRHFYVRKWRANGKQTGIVASYNALEAAYGQSHLDPALPVRGLAKKLQEYHIHNIRIWPAGPTPEDNVA